MNDLNKYLELDSINRLEFGECSFIEIYKNHEQKELYRFLKSVILDESENTYIRRKTIEFLVLLTMEGKTEVRWVINILLDEWNTTDNIHLETLRLKRLMLFYEYEKEGILQNLIDSAESSCQLISSESHYILGIVTIYKINQLSEKSAIQEILIHAANCFLKSSELEENRIDAIIFLKICKCLISALNKNTLDFDCSLSELKKLIWEQKVFTMDAKIQSIHSDILITFQHFRKLIEINTTNWVHYKKEINRLCYSFYEMQNYSIQKEHFFQELENSFGYMLIKKTVNPIFKYNFRSIITKIDVLLDESRSSKDTDFLNYIKSIIRTDTKGKNKQGNFNFQHLKSFYPHLTEEQYLMFENAITEKDGIGVIQFLNIMNRLTYEYLFKKITEACMFLQGNKIFYNQKEDDLNSFIATHIQDSRLKVKDQTRWGVLHCW